MRKTKQNIARVFSILQILGSVRLANESGLVHPLLVRDVDKDDVDSSKDDEYSRVDEINLEGFLLDGREHKAKEAKFRWPR